MPGYAAQSTVTTGQVMTAAYFNANRDNVSAVAQTKFGVVYKNATQSPANTTLTQVTWPASLALNDVALSSDQLAVTYAAWYLVTAQIEWASNATGYRLMYLQANPGGTNVAEDGRSAASGTLTTNRIVAPVFLSAAGSLAIYAQQSSGGALAIGAGVASSYFSVQLLSW